jgi:hypothetical protein
LSVIEEVKKIQTMTCRSCGYGSPNNKIDGTICCWRKRKIGDQQFPDVREPEFSCEFWSGEKK